MTWLLEFLLLFGLGMGLLHYGPTLWKKWLGPYYLPKPEPEEIVIPDPLDEEFKELEERVRGRGLTDHELMMEGMAKQRRMFRHNIMEIFKA